MKRPAAIAMAICVSIFCLASGRAETTTICRQAVNYAAAPPAADLSPAHRAFHGIWAGEAQVPGGVSEGTMCIGFVIEHIASDATVKAQYIWGDGVRFGANGFTFAIKPGVAPWPGIIAGNVLRLSNENTAHAFELHAAGNTMRGLFLTPNGRGDVQLRRQ
jgi:hypothetical protein